MSITIIRAAAPIQPSELVLGTEWLRRYSFSKNIRVGNSEAMTWITIVPGLEEVNLTAQGTAAERSNYLIADANINNNRSDLDFVDNNIVRRS